MICESFCFFGRLSLGVQFYGGDFDYGYEASRVYCTLKFSFPFDAFSPLLFLQAAEFALIRIGKE